LRLILENIASNCFCSTVGKLELRFSRLRQSTKRMAGIS